MSSWREVEKVPEWEKSLGVSFGGEGGREKYLSSITSRCPIKGGSSAKVRRWKIGGFRDGGSQTASQE